MATYNNIKKIKIGDNIFNLYDSGNSGGTVTSVAVSNATNGGLSVSGSPISTNGTITIGHSNVLSSAQTTQAVYPIKIDKNGHISAYGSAVTIVNTRGTAASGGTTLSVVNTGDMYTWNNKQDKLTNPVTGTGTSGYLVKWNGSTSVTNGPQLGSSTTTFLRNDGNWATPANTDEKVTQTATTTDATYEILFSGTADNTTRTEGTRKTNTLTYNPSTKTLTTTNIVATYLKATDAKITNILEANEVHTNKWTAANIANIGGSFYISPTMESNITGVTISVSSDIYTFKVTGGTFSTTAANISWNTGSRVMATGTITKGGVDYPLGTVIGELSAINSSSFTINNIYSANKGTLDKISAASGTYGTSKVQISMYQIKDSSTYKPVGIYLTSYGADTSGINSSGQITRDSSLDTFIDIYGGTNTIGSNAGMGGADPNVRIGYLSHLDPYNYYPSRDTSVVSGKTYYTYSNSIYTKVTSPSGNPSTKNYYEAIQPTGWGIYTDNGFFKGAVIASSGRIGDGTAAWSIGNSGNDSAYIYSPLSRIAWNTNVDGIWIGTNVIAGGPQTGSAVSGQYASTDPKWYIKANGDVKFGELTYINGTLTVPAAKVTGTLAAGTIQTNVLSALQAKLGTLTSNSLSSIVADIGTITAGVIKHDTVGGTNGIWFSAATDTSSNVTVGNSGARKDWRLLVNNKFGVTTGGVLYANGGSFNGRIEATEGYFAGSVTIGSGGSTITNSLAAKASVSAEYSVSIVTSNFNPTATSGTLVTLTAKVARVDGTAVGTISYKWYGDNTEISGATSASYNVPYNTTYNTFTVEIS